MTINVPLLRKIKRHIQEEPRRLKMRFWGRKVDPLGRGKPPCGTQACLAGWAVLLSIPRKEWDRTIQSWQPQPDAGEAKQPDNKAARLMGVPVRKCPFYQTRMSARGVIKWIDKKIEEAKSA